LLDSIKDKFDEYSDYLTDANDLISNTLSMLKDNILSRVHK